jgi:hypothetical protein
MNGAYVTERWLTVYENWLRLGIALIDMSYFGDRNDVITEVLEVSTCMKHLLLETIQFGKSFKQNKIRKQGKVVMCKKKLCFLIEKRICKEKIWKF